jgi:hypothetical protein
LNVPVSGAPRRRRRYGISYTISTKALDIEEKLRYPCIPTFHRYHGGHQSFPLRIPILRYDHDIVRYRKKTSILIGQTAWNLNIESIYRRFSSSMSIDSMSSGQRASDWCVLTIAYDIVYDIDANIRFSVPKQDQNCSSSAVD